MTKTQHPEIDEVRYRLRTYLTAHTAHGMLDAQLEPDEHLRAMAVGGYDHGRGVAALTDRRVLFVQEAVAGGAVRSLPLAEVTSVEYARRGNVGTVTVRTARSCHQLYRAAILDGRGLAEAIQAVLDARRAAEAAEAARLAEEEALTEGEELEEASAG